MLLLLPLHLIQPNTLYTQMNAKNVSFSVSSQTTSAHCECVHLCGAAHSTLYLPAILIGFCFASWPARTPPYLPVSSSSNQSHFHPLCKLCVYQQQEVLHSRAHRNRARDVHRRRRRRHQFNWLCGSSPWIFRLCDCESISINLHVNTHSLSHSPSHSVHSFGCHTTAVRVENSSHRMPSLSSHRLRYKRHTKTSNWRHPNQMNQKVFSSAPRHTRNYSKIFKLENLWMALGPIVMAP